jgi:isoleucyl-tRNA synthetase
MDVVRRVVNLGRGLRKREDLRVRQPLSKLTVVSHDAAAAAAVASHRELIAEELNTSRVEVEDDEDHLVVLSAKANFKAIGPRLGSGTRAVAAAIEALDHAAVRQLLDGETVSVAGEPITLDDVVVQRAPLPGVVVAAESLMSVALDTELTPELIAEGLAREVVNRVQARRRDSGLAVSDRIVLRWDSPDDELAAAIADHATLIADEVLAVAVDREDGLDGAQVEVDGRSLVLSIEKQ